MGDPSDDDVPTMTSSADLRRDDGGSRADADDRTIQKAPDAVAAIEAEAARGPMSKPRPAAGALSAAPGKLPPPPAHPLRPRLPSSPNALAPARAEPVKKEPAKSDSKSDSKSDVRTVQSTRDSGADPLDADPPQSEPATSPKSPALIAASRAPQTPKVPNAPAIPRSTRGPMVPTSARAPAPSSVKKSPSQPEAARDGDGEGDGDSITATAPRLSAPMIPLSTQGPVQIRTLGDDDSADETEVKTLAADVGEIVRSARGGASEADAADDSVTAQAPVASSGTTDADKDKTAAVIRIGGKSLMPKTRSSAKAEGPYNPDEEDSVTSQTPNLRGALPEPVDGETEGTTKRVRTKSKAADPNASEADEPDDSVTAAAPGHLTNMLRVIAAPSDAEGDDDRAQDDDDVQAHTQVMLGAPVKPPDAPSSESGLKVTGHDHRIGERASLGGLGMQSHPGSMRGPIASDPAPFAPMPMPMPDDDKKPPYALVVGVVAAVSILIPVLLFIILSQGSADIDAPRVTTQPSPDPIGVTGPRPRAEKSAPSATPSVRPTTPGGGPTNRGPFRR